MWNIMKILWNKRSFVSFVSLWPPPTPPTQHPHSRTKPLQESVSQLELPFLLFPTDTWCMPLFAMVWNAATVQWGCTAPGHQTTRNSPGRPNSSRDVVVTDDYLAPCFLANHSGESVMLFRQYQWIFGSCLWTGQFVVTERAISGCNGRN